MTAGIDFGLAFFINAFLNLAFGVPADADRTRSRSSRIVLFIHGLLNTFGIRLVAILNDVSVWWHIVGVAAIVARLRRPQPAHPDRPRARSSRERSTTRARRRTSRFPGFLVFGIPLYVALIGLLNAQYTLTGYDASAHMSEETHDADESAPRGIVCSVVISVISASSSSWR